MDLLCTPKWRWFEEKRCVGGCIERRCPGAQGGLEVWLLREEQDAGRGSFGILCCVCVCACARGG